MMPEQEITNDGDEKILQEYESSESDHIEEMREEDD